MMIIHVLSDGVASIRVITLLHTEDCGPDLNHKLSGLELTPQVLLVPREEEEEEEEEVEECLRAFFLLRV